MRTILAAVGVIGMIVGAAVMIDAVTSLGIVWFVLKEARSMAW
jgi:hypothetical protein